MDLFFDSGCANMCVAREPPEKPAPTIRMSHSDGSVSVERWLSSDPGEDRQKEVIPLTGGNGFDAMIN
jgi:hypothetical protein